MNPNCNSFPSTVSDYITFSSHLSPPPPHLLPKEDGPTQVFSVPHPSTIFASIAPSRPSQNVYSNVALVRVAVLCVTSVTCDFPLFIPHSAVNFKTIPHPAKPVLGPQRKPGLIFESYYFVLISFN